MSIKKISTKVQGRQKPTEYDIHLKYVCEKCGANHWLSINEASTKWFRIVCDCGNIFSVKRVKDFKLLFHHKKKSKTTLPKQDEKPTIVEKPVLVISSELLEQTISVLMPYGFTKTEAKDMAIKSYTESPKENTLELVKQILESLRNTNVK